MLNRIHQKSIFLQNMFNIISLQINNKLSNFLKSNSIHSQELRNNQEYKKCIQKMKNKQNNIKDKQGSFHLISIYLLDMSYRIKLQINYKFSNFWKENSIHSQELRNNQKCKNYILIMNYMQYITINKLSRIQLINIYLQNMKNNFMLQINYMISNYKK